MGKAPAEQFYWGDWLNDVELQAAHTVTRGVWINALCRMWYSKTKGEISGTREQLSMICNCKIEEFDVFLDDIKTLGFCYTLHDTNGNVMLRNRRMWRKEKDRENNRLRQKRHYDKKHGIDQPNKDLTPPSSSSSSTSPSKIDISNDIFGKCPHNKIIELYHKILPELPQVKIWNDAQKKILRTRWKEDITRQNMEWWQKYFKYIHLSEFLMGKKTDFMANFEWVVRPKNFVKIINGSYHRGVTHPLKGKVTDKTLKTVINFEEWLKGG